MGSPSPTKGLVALSEDHDAHIAAGAKVLTRDEAKRHQIQLLHEWEPSSDIVALRYGSSVLSVCAVAPAIAIGVAVRNVHGLRHVPRGRISLSLASSITPFLGSLMIWENVISDLVLGETPCYVCLHTRTVAQSVAVNVGFSTAMSLAGGYTSMQALGRVRKYTDLGFLPWCRKILRQNSGIVTGNFVFQVLAASGLLWLMKREWDNVEIKNAQRLQKK